MTENLVFYTDGSAHPNPGKGGFGIVLIDNNEIKTYAEHFEKTTNNAMEMRAIIWAACYALSRGQSAEIYSDSSYAINTFSSWMYNWSNNNWTTKGGKTPENLELVKAFFEINKQVKITLHKVKGHNGLKYNELADKLATEV